VEDKGEGRGGEGGKEIVGGTGGSKGSEKGARRGRGRRKERRGRGVEEVKRGGEWVREGGEGIIRKLREGRQRRGGKVVIAVGNGGKGDWGGLDRGGGGGWAVRRKG